MAEDITDFFLKTIFQAIGWVFKQLFKLAWLLIAGIFGLLFKGIKALFSKSGDEGARAVEESGRSSDEAPSGAPEGGISYDDCVKAIDDAGQLSDESVKSQRLTTLFCSVLTDPDMSVDKKCELIVLGNGKVIEMCGGDAQRFNRFYTMSIQGAFMLLKAKLGDLSVLIEPNVEEFVEAVNTGSLNSMSAYFGEIMRFAETLHPKDHSTYSEEKLAGYALPEWQ